MFSPVELKCFDGKPHQIHKSMKMILLNHFKCSCNGAFSLVLFQFRTKQIFKDFQRLECFVLMEGLKDRTKGHQNDWKFMETFKEGLCLQWLLTFLVGKSVRQSQRLKTAVKHLFVVVLCLCRCLIDFPTRNVNSLFKRRLWSKGPRGPWGPLGNPSKHQWSYFPVGSTKH